MNYRNPVCRILRFVLPLVIVVTTLSHSYAQQTEKSAETLEPGVATPGMIRLKIKRESFKPEITPSFFGEIGKLLGVSEVTSWLNPRLLRYANRHSNLYKTQWLGYESWAGSLSRIVVVHYVSDIGSREAAGLIASIPEVEYAEPIWERKFTYVPNDPDARSGRQWHLDAIKAFQAWDIQRGDSTITIGIIDTGIEPDHQDLQEAIWLNPGEAGENRDNGLDDDENGLIDDWRGYDFGGVDGYSPDNDPTPFSDSHGTHVAGIAGATGDNDIGVAGVAYGVKLMSVKISEDGLDPKLPGDFDGILYAATMGAQIINCSWGGTGRSIAEQEVIDAVTDSLGVLVVAAAGNGGMEQLFYPASYNNVLSVAATDRNGSKWEFSNYHHRVDLSAPGYKIWSTKLYGRYGYEDGTSMATPMVAAGAALLLSKNPALKPEETAEILRATTDPFSPIAIGQFTDKLGTGRLNLQNAIERMDAISSARMVDYTVDDPNDNGMIDPGETIALRADVKNILADASNVSLVVEPVSPANLVIEGNSVDFGPMSSGQQSKTPADKLRITIAPDAEPDSKIQLKVTVTTEDRSNVEYVNLIVFPTWQTTSLNNISATFNSVGNIGYNGTNREEGEGFYYKSKGSLLWHAGLMIGTSETKLADVVRIGLSRLGTDNGFVLATPFRLSRDQTHTVETGKATFTDRDDLIGVDVAITTKEYRGENFVLVMYEITNTSGSRLDNLFCGLYLDWDLSKNGTGDVASWDAINKLGFVRNLNDTSLWTGASLLSDQEPNYYAANSQGDDHYIIFNFADVYKWNMLSNGVSRKNTPTDNAVDASMTIGGGPVSIEPDESTTFAYALMAGPDLKSLQTAVTEAKNRYRELVSVPYDPRTSSGITIQALPSPFTYETTIFLTLARPDRLSVEVFNLSGERVAILHEGPLHAREHPFWFEAGELASGVYIVKASGEGIQGEKKMVLVR